MKKKAKNRERYRLTRPAYEKAKKLDHDQFETFCTGIYNEGYERGRASIPQINLGDVEAAIRSVKGIGETRRKNIMNAITEKLYPALENKVKNAYKEVHTDEIY